MDFVNEIKEGVANAINALYGETIEAEKVTLNPTKKDFDGDYTVVVFPYVKMLRKSPQIVGNELGSHLVDSLDFIKEHNTIQGFLNLTFTDTFWAKKLKDIRSQHAYGTFPANGEKVMVEFSSPNTNKPLHLGHIRNILLGWSCSQILEAAGYEVIKTQIINDRGIAVCKSMLAWSKFGSGATPESEDRKGDHFVGHFYVLFEQKFREEYNQWQQSKEGVAVFEENKKENQEKDAFFKAYKNTYFNEYSALGGEAKEMLRKWESGDKEVRDLWSKMNGWVYDGFDITYQNMGVSFDKLYYESDTYLLGKDIIKEGTQKGVFYEEKDGSMWVDLEDVGMDKKIVLRSDGTAVYMTQDMGTASVRYQDFGAKNMVYVVADEQDYHFKALFEIMKKMGAPFADGLFHLSYGMVDLPTGKMKSREGTVVDADDLMEEVIEEARISAQEHGEISEMSEEAQLATVRKIGLSALKFFIIKVQPRKRMTFDPKESVDMQGQTGPYIQNAYVRIRSILRKNENSDIDGQAISYNDVEAIEKELVKLIIDFPSTVKEAADQYDPSTIANYCYLLAKTFHRFYHEVRILNAETIEAKAFRLELCEVVADVLKRGMGLLGIEMPERM